MPYKSCSASFCDNNIRKCRMRGAPTLFHHFPPDPEMSRQWVGFCKQTENWRPSKCSAVCSEHFQPEDYQLCKLPLDKLHPNLRVLKATAVPSIVNTEPTPKKTTTKQKIVEEAAKKIQDPLNESIVESQSNLDTFDSSTMTASSEDDSMDLEFINVDDVELSQANKQIVELKCKNRELTEENERLTCKINSLIIQNGRLKAEIKKKNGELDQARKGFLDSAQAAPLIKSKLKSSLSYNQIDIILDLKKWVNWTLEEIGAALTLRYFSKRAYKYLAVDLNYPLPSLSTLQRHARTVNLKQGILEDVITMVGNLTRTFTKKGKECVLSFGEMDVRKVIEYDIAADEIVGPFSYMQVVMARGLFQKWKQPVYIGFDQKMTKDILCTLIKKLYDKEVNVVAIVSNNASANIACWRDLGVQNSARPFFKHPVTNKYVYIIPDSSVLLKQIRNSLFDCGFVYKGNTITADVLYDLVASGEMTEVTSAFKLSQSHIEMASHERQNVRKAAELLSRATAISLRKYFPDCSDAKNMADIIEIIALWYRTSNPHSPIYELNDDKAYHGIQKQMSALENMHEFILNMRVIGNSKLQIFQKSVLMQITSIKMLFVNMHEKHQIQVLFTQKLNQDSLASFFSQIRQGNGDYDHPSPLSCLHRIRLLLLSKSATISQNQTSLDPAVQSEQESVSIPEENEHFITATLFSSADIGPIIAELQSPKDTNDRNSDSGDVWSSSMVDLPTHESDALQYIVGFIAKKFSSKFPELQLGTEILNTNSDHSYSHHTNFLQQLSVEGLFLPSSDFLEACHIMDNIFNSIHPEGQFKYNRKIVARCCRKIENQLNEVPPLIIESFVKIRVNVRVRYMNMNLNSEKSMHRKRKLTTHVK